MRKVLSLAVLACFGVAAFLQPPLAQAPQQNSPATAAATRQAPALQAQTRLITVDVVATDSHGKPIRGLTQDDFQLSEEHAGQQKIAKFRFVEPSASVPAPAGPVPPGAHVYSNQTLNKLNLPPSILLMDALNTDLDQQAFVHHQALLLLKTLPASTPIAVFVLGHSLEVLQSFTTDPALLRTAVDHMLRGIDIAPAPQDDPNSMSNASIAANDGEDTAMNQTLEDFEATTYEGQMSIRVDETTDAMVAIAKYLKGYPGRKNLLWFSEAFPNWIQPAIGFGNDEFSGSASYSDKIQKSFEALADAQVAVYPVDARGLDTSDLFTASGATPNVSSRNPGAGLAGPQSREEDRRVAAQATLEEIAQGTGGKVCENTNNLSECVQTAMDDSSAYYELSYYPENVRWDGRFHKITVKSNQHGVKLRYRTGYFATDPAALAKDQTPQKLLQQACMGPLPSTAIPLTVVPLTARPAQGQTPASQNRYLLTISPSALTLPGTGTDREMRAQMAVCEYDKKGDSFAIYPHDLSRSVPDALFADWQANGVRSIYDYEAKPDNQHLRFAVLDIPSGATGSVDVPAHPPEFAAAPAPAPVAAPPPPPVRIPFKGSAGTSSALDWSTGTVSYTGNISVDQGATAFFKAAYGAKFHCESGRLVANNPAPGVWPDLSLIFRAPGGHDAFVELGGDAPTYSGDVPVDASGRAFFDYLWKLTHCQQP